MTAIILIEQGNEMQTTTAQHYMVPFLDQQKMYTLSVIVGAWKSDTKNTKYLN